jgi:hypothetical protein
MIRVLPTGQPLFADEDAILHTMIDGVDINLWTAAVTLSSL